MAKNIKITSNIKLKTKQIKSYARKLNNKFLKDGMFLALDMVGNISVSEFMEDVGIDHVVTAPTGSKLRIRSSRLAASILGAWRFSEAKYPSKMRKFDKNVVITQKGDFQQGKKESIRKVIINNRVIIGKIGSETPYAAIHEHGGRAGRNKSIMIPKRSYIEPAAISAIPDISNMFKTMVEETWAGANI